MLRRLNRSLLPWPRSRLNADKGLVGPVGVGDAVVCAIGPVTAVDASSDYVDVSVGASLVGGAQGLHPVGLPPMAADAPRVLLRDVGLADFHNLGITDGIGKGLVVVAPRHLDPAGAGEFHPIAWVDVAQVLAAFVVAAVVDFNRVTQPAGFMAALPQEIDQLQRVHLAVSDAFGKVVNQRVVQGFA